MPLYEYDCPGCGQPFEKRVSMANADQTDCPTCGSTHTKRRLSRIAIKGQSTNGAATAAAPLPIGGL